MHIGTSYRLRLYPYRAATSRKWYKDEKKNREGEAQPIDFFYRQYQKNYENAIADVVNLGEALPPAILT